MLSLLHLVVKAQQYFVTLSSMLLDKKTVLEIWLNLGSNLTIFQGTGPWRFDCIQEKAVYYLKYCVDTHLCHLEAVLL